MFTKSDRQPMNFCLGIGFKNNIDREKFKHLILSSGGVVRHNPDNESYYLIDPYAWNQQCPNFKTFPYKMYDAKFITDSYSMRFKQDIEQYRLYIEPLMAGSEESPISMLNDDCLSTIFEYLPVGKMLQVEIVSKQWQRASKLACHVTKTFIFGKWRFPLTRRMEPSSYLKIKTVLIRCGLSLKNIELHRDSNLEILRMIRDCCPEITSLFLFIDIQNKRYKKKDKVGVISGMQKLRSLSIIFDSKQASSILPDISDNASLQKLVLKGLTTTTFPILDITLPTFQNLHSLKILYICLKQRDMEAIALNQNLKTLHLLYCQFLKPLSINVNSNLENLEDLRLSGDNQSNGCSLFIDMTKKSNQLKYLNFSGTRALYDVNLIVFANHGQLEYLKVLNVQGCWEITNTSIKTILKEALNLEQLDIRYTSTTIEILAYAACITRKRQNNIVLNIQVDYRRHPKEDVNIAPEHVSPYLCILFSK